MGLCLFVFTSFAGKMTVVLPVKSTMTEKAAAEELKTLLKKTSQIVIVKEGAAVSGKVIYVGNTAYAGRHGAVRKFDAEEWLIRGIDGSNLILNGGRRGVLYAAYELLERLSGVMFLDQYTTYGPEKEPAWDKNTHFSGKPAFEWRSLYSYFPSDNRGRHTWSMRSRQNFFLNEKLYPHMKAWGLAPFFGKPRANHTFYYYTREWKNVPDEYFALSPKNGKRERATGPSGPGQICFTHPEVRKLFAAQLEKFIQADLAEYKDVPPPVYYAISPNDNNYPCVCSNCKAAVKRLGNYTGLVIDFVNDLARSVKKYPHVKLKMSAYLFSQTPPVPGTKLEKNVIPGIAQMGMEWEDFSEFQRTRRESMLPLTHKINAKAFKEFKTWASFGRLATWDYYITWQNRGYLLDNCEAIKENLKIYKSFDLEVLFGEIEDPLQTSFHALRMYLIHRLWNDPALDAEKEIDRFMTAYYGKAAQEMKAVRRLILAENKSLDGKLTVPMVSRKGLDVRYFTQAEKLFTAALAKAGKDKLLAQRIKRERINFDRIRLMLPSIPENLAPGAGVVGKRMTADFRELAPKYYSGKRLQEECAGIERAAAGALYSTAPVKEFPGRKVIAHFTGNSFPAQYRAKIGKDPASAKGTALYHPVNGPVAEGIRFGYNNSVRKKAVSHVLKKDEFKFDGKYHWYRIGEVELAESCYVFAHKSWEMQRRLHEVYNVPKDNVADIYVKLKAELDPKDPARVDKLWMDGVLLLEPVRKDFSRLEDFPGRKVAALFTELRPQYKVKRVRDDKSLKGTALMREVNDPVGRGIRVGYYDISAKKSWTRVLTAKDFKFDGKYRWYTAGVIPVGGNGYAHVHVSTEFQQRLDTVARKLPNGLGEVAFRLKAELDPSGKIIRKIYLDAIAVLLPAKEITAAFAGKKIAAVYDAKDIPALYKVRKTVDKEASSGVALVRDVNDPVGRGLRVAYYNISGKKTGQRTFRGKDLPLDGKYHWYTLEKAVIGPNGYAHADWSCEFQRSLNEFYKNSRISNADISFRIKVKTDPSKKFIKQILLDSIVVTVR